MIAIIVTLFTSCLASTPLFSERELKEVERLKSPERFSKMRLFELQSSSERQISLMLKIIGKSEQRFLDKKVNKKFWKRFDQYTDDQLRIKIMTDLILKDLYKDEGE